MKNSIVKSLFVSLLIMVITIGCGGRAGNKEEKKRVLTSFPKVVLPSVLTSPIDQLEYLADHYWDNYDFADTALIHNPDVTEQGFSDFVGLISNMNGDLADSAITKMLSKAHVADSVMFDHFLELSDKYFYDPNSPLRSEDNYMSVLNYIISSPAIGDIDKVRPIHILDMLKKNRPGDIAGDFEYKLKSGKEGTLMGVKSDYTLLFFNNPDCGECARVKSYIVGSDVISKLEDKKELKVLAICPDEDLTAWTNDSYPSSWISGYDSTQYLTNNKVYDLRAIPSLYLLDNDKRVILKDANIEQIERWLGSIEQ